MHVQVRPLPIGEFGIGTGRVVADMGQPIEGYGCDAGACGGGCDGGSDRAGGCGCDTGVLDADFIRSFSPEAAARGEWDAPKDGQASGLRPFGVPAHIAQPSLDFGGAPLGGLIHQQQLGELSPSPHPKCAGCGPSLGGPLMHAEPLEFGDPPEHDPGNGMWVTHTAPGPYDQWDFDRWDFGVELQGPPADICWHPPVPPFFDWANWLCFGSLWWNAPNGWQAGQGVTIQDFYERVLPDECCEMVGVLEWGTRPCVVPSGPHIDEVIARLDFTWEVFVPPGIEAANIELIEAAWAVVVDNMDVIKWLMCMFQEWVLDYNQVPMGHPNANGDLPATIEALIQAFDENVKGNDVDGGFELIGRSGGGLMFNHDHEGQIWFMPEADSKWTSQYVRAWLDAEDDAERLCVAVILASTLLTEILHSAGVGHNYWPGQSEKLYDIDGKVVLTPWGTTGCDFVLMIKTTFLHVMSQRYSPCLAGEACCSQFGRSQYWSRPEQVHPPKPPGSCH